MRTVVLLLAGLVGAVLVLVFCGRWYFQSLPDSKLAWGRELIRQGKYEEAKRVAAKLNGEGLTDHARLLRGLVLFSLAGGGNNPDSVGPEEAGLYQQALSQFDQIEAKGELRLEAAIRAGQALLALKEFAAAEPLFRFVADQKPDSIDARRGLAAVYYDLGAMSHAAEQLLEVARLDPEDGRPHRLLGLIAKDMDRAEEAAGHYREALRRKLSEGTVQQVRVELAEVLVRLSKYPEALEAVEGSKPAPAEVGKAVALRAECLWGLGRLHEASRLLEEALDLELRVPETLRLKAKLHIEAGQAPDAVRLLEEAVQLDKHDFASRYQLAQALEAVGRKQEAEEQRGMCEKTRELFSQLSQFTQEAMMHPTDAGIRLRLAEVCDKLEKKELAALWRKAAEALASVPR